MSLQIWLPLNGDLHNQGLYELPNTSQNTATYNINGKIGSCMTGSTAWHLSNEILDNEWSVALWMKPTSAFGANNNILFCKNTSASNDCQIYFSIINGTSLHLGVNGATSTVSQSYTFETNKWYHLVGTFDGLTAKLYINGVLQKSGTTSAAQPTGKLNIRINGRSTNAANTSSTGSLSGYNFNDFRLYNHALSAKEVKEIAKGLTIHYKLDDTYLETANMLSCSITETAYNGATGKYGYNDTSNLIKTTGFFQGKNCIKIGTRTANQTARPYSYFGNLFTSDGTNAPAYKALSFDYYTTVPTTTWLNIYKLGSGSGTATWKTTNSDGVHSGTYNNSSNSIIVKPNEWNHVEVILHGTTEANAEWGYCINGPDHTTSENYYFLYANIQLEENDHVTGYGSNFHQNKVQDCSGYQNNGTISNVSILDDTNRYSHSMKFSGTTSYVKITDNKWMAQHAEAMTINLWVKNSSWATNTHFFSCTESGGFNTEPGNSGYLRFPVYVCTNAEQTSYAYKYDSKELQISAIPTNEWVMLTWVYDNTGTRTYINGQLHHTYTNTSYGIRFNMNARLFLGCEASGANPTTPYYSGQESDFRLYYTALTEDQILELYNTSMSIDNKGNGYAREIVEYSNLNITKTGQFHGNELIDDNTFTTASITKNDRQLKVNTFYEY